jgi:hypothetical protein
MNMNTNNARRATNRKIVWRHVKPVLYDAYEPHEAFMQPDDWIMNVDGRDIAKLHFQSNMKWMVCIFIRQQHWWPRGCHSWVSEDRLMREMDLAVEELLDDSRTPPRSYFVGIGAA